MRWNHMRAGEVMTYTDCKASEADLPRKEIDDISRLGSEQAEASNNMQSLIYITFKSNSKLFLFRKLVN